MDIKIDKVSFYTNNSPHTRIVPVFTSSPDSCSFGTEYERYKSAKQYADSIIKKKGVVNLDKCDLKRLEGLQYGIEGFEGLNMKQLYMLYKHLRIALLHRGCSNGCVHCFAEAKPVTFDSDTLHTMSWEDFQKLTTSFETLDKRLGYSRKTPNPTTKDSILPFLDADSMEIILKDKHGNSHDMIEIAQNFYSKMGKKVLFDTSGWNPKSVTMQKRAQKYVEYFASADGQRDFVAINISLNPFHKLYAKSVSVFDSNPSLAKKLRDLYTERMANVFYTFAPVMDKDYFNVLNRAIDDDLICDENYKVTAHRKLISEIREKLVKRFFNSDYFPDYVKSRMELFDKFTEYVAAERLAPIGRLRNIYPKNTIEYMDIEREHLELLQNPKGVLGQFFSPFAIDVNGHVFATNMTNNVPTDISLNLGSKGMKTPQIYSMIDSTLDSDEMYKILSAKPRTFIERLYKFAQRLFRR